MKPNTFRKTEQLEWFPNTYYIIILHFRKFAIFGKWCGYFYNMFGWIVEKSVGKMWRSEWKMSGYLWRSFPHVVKKSAKSYVGGVKVEKGLSFSKSFAQVLHSILPC